MGCNIVLFALRVFCLVDSGLINCDVSSGKFEEKQVHATPGNTFHYPQTQFSHIEINFLSGFVQLTPNLDHKVNTKSRIRSRDITRVSINSGPSLQLRSVENVTF